jgi:serine/threonine-protein kinase
MTMSASPGPSPWDNDRNLLFGVLALQAGLLDAGQFVEACSSWAGRKDVPLADLVIERGWLSNEDRAHVEYLLNRALRKHGGDARRSLADIAGENVRDALRSVDDAAVQQTMTHLPPAPSYVLVTTMDTNLGQRSRYTLTRIHGEGGLGRVYVAHDQDLNRDVALKELRPEKAQHPETWRRFFREAQLTGQLEHPNIVPVYEVGRREEDGQPFYTMRLVRGRTLREALREFHQRRREGRTDPLEWPKLLNNFVSICNAVGYAHSRGVVHRDLKPENVMLGGHGEVIVLDWGLAKVVGQRDQALPAVALTEEAQADETIAGRMLGTPAYAAPEQAEGRLDLIDARTDVYGLGAILFEILTDKPPHSAEDTGALLRQIVSAATPSARRVDATVAPALDAICAKAMARDRADRYSRPEDLARDVERWLADEPVTAHREPISTRLWRRARRHKTLVTSSALLLITGLLFVSVLAVLLEGARERTDRARAEAEANFKEAEEQRARADRNFRQARQAVDDYFTRISENKLLGLPHLEPLRKELLDKAREYYQRFAEEAAHDPKVQADHATAVFRVATIIELTGSKEEARSNYDKAIKLYQTVLAGESTSPERDRWRNYLGVCSSDYGLVLMEDGSMDEAARLFEQSRAVFEPLVAEKPAEVRYRGGLAKCYLNTALWHYRVGAIDEADRHYTLCRKLQEEIVHHNPALSEYQADLALTIMNQGSLCLENGKPEKALELYGTVKMMVEPLVRDHAEAIYYKRLLGAIQHNVGMLHRLLSRFDRALAAYEEARRIRGQLAEEHPSVTDYQNDLGETLNNIGELQLARRHKTEAFATLKQAGEHFEKVAMGSTANAKYRSALSLARNNLGVVLQQTEKHAEALAEHQQALALREELARKNPQVTDYQAHLADTYSNLANTLRSQDKKEEALTYYQKSCAAYEPLVARQPTTTKYRTNLALAYTNMGYLHEEAERFEEALAALQKSLVIREALLAANPYVPRFQADVAQSHFYIAKVLTRLGFPRYRSIFCGTLAGAPSSPFTTLACLCLPPDDTEYHFSAEAIETFGKVIDMQARLIQANQLGIETPAAVAELLASGTGSTLGTLITLEKEINRLPVIDYRADLGRTYIQLANVYRDGKELFKAFEWNKKAVEAWTQVAQEAPAEDEFRSNLAVSQSNFGMTLQDLRLSLAAQSAHSKGRELREKLVEANPDNKDYRRDLAESYNSLGIATLSLRRRNEAFDWFRKAEAGFQYLVDKYPDNARYRSDFARAILNEGITFIEMGQPDKAIPYLQRSLPIQRQSMDQKPGRYRFRELVGKTYGQLAVAYAALNNEAEAKAALDERRRLWTLQADGIFDMVIDLAKCVTVVGNSKDKLTAAEEAAKSRYADRAMATLREAIAAGYQDRERLRTETKLAPLRERDDFNKLLDAWPQPDRGARP